MNKILVNEVNLIVIFNMDKIQIHIINVEQACVKAVCQILINLTKYGFFINFKQYYLYKAKLCFLKYIVLD